MLEMKVESNNHRCNYRTRSPNRHWHTDCQLSVAKTLGKSLITWCKFWEAVLKKIKPMFTIAEMDSWSTFVIIRQPSKPNTTVLLQKNRYLKCEGNVHLKIKTTKVVRLKPATQTLLELANKISRTILVYPLNPLSKNDIFSAAARIASIQSDKPFQILVAEFNEHSIYLLPNKKNKADNA